MENRTCDFSVYPSFSFRGAPTTKIQLKGLELKQLNFRK